MANTIMDGTEENSQENLTEIQKFYHGSTIFITGATGFLGHILLTKLLRSCPGIKKIYILIRKKKDGTPSERFARLFSNEILETVKLDCPDYRDKVKLIIGDCEQPQLGINEKDLHILENEVNMVFHVAATVRFDAPLQDATIMNVRCTRDLLNIAKNMKKLKIFTYVSTAFSNCVGRRVIEEKFYDSPISANGLISLVEEADTNIIEKITPCLLESYPNTYVFTKAVAEDLCRSLRSKLPLAVFRPAIVISTAKEPVPGWINNIYGPTGIVAAAGAGILRTLHSNENCVTNVVPCDYVINALIAAAWEVGTTWKKAQDCTPVEIQSDIGNGQAIASHKMMPNGILNGAKLHNGTCNGALQNGGGPFKDTKVPIYNFSSSCVKNPMRWKEFMSGNEAFEPEFPFSVATGAYSFTLNKHKFIHQLYCMLFHFVPAFFVDLCNKILCKDTDMINRYQKLHKLCDVLSYFSTREWDIKNYNVQHLWQKLHEKDKNTFYFDMNTINWNEYFRNHITGIRLYIVKDSMETVAKARRRRTMLRLLRYLMSGITGGMLFLLACKISSLILKTKHNSSVKA